ncbi:hypothetical protein NIES4075_28680 [Tolypothrix sp. NIES-4075]|nr:hypothetical protein NIES4075_28680 [Tolypothrix sp. NIES-4075]
MALAVEASQIYLTIAQIETEFTWMTVNTCKS